MPTFCGKCGAPVTGKFCGKCGAAIAEPGAATPPVEASTNVQTPVAAEASSNIATPAPTAYTAAPAQPAGGSAVKIILAVLGVFVFLGLLGMGSCLYIGYRAKQKINALAGNAEPYHGKKDPCALVTMSEVSRAMSRSVSGMQPVGTSACIYQLEGNQQLAIETTWESGAMTMALTHGAMKQISGMETFSKIEGLGDEAYIAPMGSALMMRKGDVMVNIDLRQGGLNVDGAKEIARKIASRL
ncbi:MAG TPA: zinc ribbon domain-containing protein [Terriglobales bacterium]|jgi:hypothetical protein|nr:zinc ribbon domain-containing protein [Terriglobales bacterium]